MYTSVKGIYDNGVLTLLEPAPNTEKTEVLVTFMTSVPSKPPQDRVPGRLKRLGDLEGKTYRLPDNFNDPIDYLFDALK